MDARFFEARTPGGDGQFVEYQADRPHVVAVKSGGERGGVGGSNGEGAELVVYDRNHKRNPKHTRKQNHRGLN